MATTSDSIREIFEGLESRDCVAVLRVGRASEAIAGWEPHSHCVYISDPKQVADVIAGAARAVSKQLGLRTSLIVDTLNLKPSGTTQRKVV